MSETRKDYLICVDSDGCAMDTMNEKHLRFFGPLAVTVFGLEAHRPEVTKRWNRINLFSETRGINRFLALILLLQELRQDGLYHQDIRALEQWAETTASLSNASLSEALAASPMLLTESPAANPDESLALALDWSNQVNEGIRTMGEGGGVFPGVPEALRAAAEHADIVVVSSANQEALLSEWEPFLQSGMVKRVMSQNDGSKSECIKTLLESGYRPDHTLMIGDAPGDRNAAKSNQVLFYPILAGKEARCWEQFREQALCRLLEQTFAGAYQDTLETEFLVHLSR